MTLMNAMPFATALLSLSASQGDLRSLGSEERNSTERRRPAGPSERARASHWAGVSCWRLTSDPEFKALAKEIKINWLK